jgi:cell division protein FtsB
LKEIVYNKQKQEITLDITNTAPFIKETHMKLPRSKIASKIIVFALIVYAGISLFALRGRIESKRAEYDELRRAVAEKEITNAELEYEVQHHDEPDVIANIARSDLGLVLPGEIVYYDGGSAAADTP